MKQFFLASGNKNKIEEISKFLQEFDIGLKSFMDFPSLEQPEEDGKTFRENAIIKAVHGFKNTGLPTIADDSGFIVDALGDLPGIRSARFADEFGGYPQAMAELERLLGSNPNRNAHFITALAFVHDDSETSGRGPALREPKIEIFEGIKSGEFTYPPRGSNGFGYCPCFTPDGGDLTYGEIPNEERCGSNHRFFALKKFRDFLETKELFAGL